MLSTAETTSTRVIESYKSICLCLSGAVSATDLLSFKPAYSSSYTSTATSSRVEDGWVSTHDSENSQRIRPQMRTFVMCRKNELARSITYSLVAGPHSEFDESECFARGSSIVK